MDTPPSPTRCPKCGSHLPGEAKQGLCPKCALAAVAMATEIDPRPSRDVAPTLASVASAFPQLEIIELIGSGGMGAVYKARQPKLDRWVALKLLSPSLATSPAFAERFHREARVLARLNHPGIVSVHDFGETGGFFFLLMEFVDGVNLRQAMEAGRFTPAQALALVPRICEALQFAHDEGILHRDIKPENILLDARGRVKIVDFGIAKFLGDKRAEGTLTGSGLAVGTPHYMAPEQLEHPQEVDQRADIYSLGVVLYEMLTGELPIGRFAPPSQKASMDPRVDDVVLRTLEKERERRQHNAAELKTEVEQITAHTSAQAVAAQPPLVRPKASPCYVTTPEHLKTFRGQFLYLYQGRGELRLGERSLSFMSGWQRVTIPLPSIRALTLGRYALTAKPVPLDYLEVTFWEGPDSRTLLFTPTLSGLGPVWKTNKVVEEWAIAVQEALQAVTGRAMALDRSVDSRGRRWTGVWETFGVTTALCTWPFLLMAILLEHRAPTQWKDWLLGPMVATVVLASLLLVRWLLERRALKEGNLGEVTAPPSVRDKGAPTVQADRAQRGGDLHPVTIDEPPTAQDAPKDRPAAVPSSPVRISWLAISSALCAIPSWLLVLGALGQLHDSLGADGLPPVVFPLSAREILVLGTGGFVGLLALFLGSAALREIRASQVTTLGARLAVLGLLGVPTGLLIRLLPPLLAWAVRSFGWKPAPGQGEIFTGAVLIGCFVMAVVAAWTLRRWATGGRPDAVASRKSMRNATGGGHRTLAVVGYGCLAGSSWLPAALSRGPEFWP
jgi:serine/threonine protein kinase